MLLFVGTKVFAQDLQKIRINPDQAYGGDFSDYLYAPEYIPLETTKESLFGQISNLIITKLGYVITDDDTKSVLFFSKSGEFVKKISKYGTYNSRVAVFDEYNNTIAIVFQNENSEKFVIKSYNIQGDYIKDINESNLDFDLIHNTIVYNENTYWKRNIPAKSDSIPAFYFSQYIDNTKSNSVISLDTMYSYGLYHLTKELGYTKLPSIFNNMFYYSTPIENKLYRVNALTGETTLLYQIIFPSKFGIDNTLLRIKDKKTMDNSLKKEWFKDKSALGLENIYHDTSKLIFKAIRGVSSSYGADGALISRNFLYLFSQNKLISFEKINADKGTYFLPFHSPHTIAREGVHFSNDYLYTHLSSLDMFTAYQVNKERNPVYPIILQDYFKTQNRKSNPVIVRMKLRD